MVVLLFTGSTLYGFNSTEHEVIREDMTQFSPLSPNTWFLPKKKIVSVQNRRTQIQETLIRRKKTLS